MKSPDTSETSVHLEGVAKRFGPVAAVQDLSLDIPAGTTFGFLGPNGAGKTTTMKMLMGLLRRDAGRINVLGIDPADDDRTVKRTVGYVPEQHFVYRWMRVDEAISFCRTLYPTWNDTLCSQLLKRFTLDGRKKVKEFSKGMAVKLSLVLALSHEPTLLVLDEPMAGLDPVVREELLEGILQSICDRRQTVVFSSHMLSDVQRVADSIGILHEGRLLVHRSVDTLVGKTKRIRAVLADRTTPTSQPEGVIWQNVARREWQMTVRDYSDEFVEQLRSANRLDHVEVLDLGLEDIFKDYIRGQRVSA